MTLKELWQLFPIILTEHNPYWEKWYKDEVEILKKILPPKILYHHIGSTAIQGIMAKPIIDILIMVNKKNELEQVTNLLEKQGYIVMAKNNNRISLNKGYTEYGYAEKVFHLHIRLKDDEDEIYFRDYLKTHSKIAKDYEQLKLELYKKFKYNRDAYTEGKTDFVKKITNLAKQKY